MSGFDSIDVQDVDGVAIVRFRDTKAVNPERIQKLGEELMGLLTGDQPRQLVIDLENVRFLSSAAINKLIVLDKRVKSIGGKMRFCNVRPEVQEVFNITHLNTVFDIRDKQADALRAFHA